jgi:hypothetical protein
MSGTGRPAPAGGAADRRARALLAAGAALGIALTAWGVVRSGPAPGGSEAAAEAVARVNGRPLSREAFERFTAAVAAERGEAALETGERRRLLQRLVDEELLLQHGIDLGLARHEPTARRVIVQSVIASVTGSAESEEPDVETLRDYHERNADRFVRPGRVVVDAWLSPVGRGDQADDAGARARAAAAVARLRAGALPEDDGLERPPLPGGPLPLETVRRYLGPTAALRARELAPGQVADPFRAAAGYVVLRVRDRTPDRVPAFETVREQVRAEWLRDQGEEALATFLERLRRSSEVEILVPELRQP